MVFLNCYTTWCGPCRQMANNVFPQKIMGDFFNANFVNIKIDMERGEGPELRERFNVTAYPTYIMFNSDGEEIARLVGGGDAETFIARVRANIDPAHRPEALRMAYEANKTFANAMAYMDALMHNRRNDDVAAFMNANFEEFTTSGERFSDDFWRYASRSITSINSNLLNFIIVNKRVYDDRIGRDRVNQTLRSAYRNILFGYVSGAVELSKEEATRAITALALLSENDVVSRYHVMVADLFLNDNIDRIIGLFHAGASFRMTATSQEISQIERLFTSVKGMPDSRKREYFEGRSRMLRSTADNLERQAERFSNAEEPSTPPSDAQPAGSTAPMQLRTR